LLRVAALLALLHVHHAAPARLDVQPRAFSPYAAPLVVSARLDSRVPAGLRLVRPGTGMLGWVLPPRRRTRISLAWRGRLGGRLLRDGGYQLQLVAGKRVLASASFRLDATAPRLTGFRASNGGTPFAGDGPLLTTISPGAESGRSEARIAFTLDEAAAVTLRVEATKRHRDVVDTITAKLGPGRHVLAWSPGATVAPRTYLLVLTARDAAGNRRRYGAATAYVRRYLPAPVVRILGVDASFASQSYAPGDAALLRVATDAPSFTLRILRAPGARPSPTPDALDGTPVTEGQEIDWSSHEDAPAAIRLPIGDWPSGLYYAELDASDGRVDYAPFVVRPPALGASSRVAVVLPTNTWQAYNFYDADGDGWGDTWYAGRSDLRVALDRPYANRGVPPKINAFEIPFLIWMARAKLTADVLSESDLDRVRSGADLAALYDLVVFPGHTEYVTTREYDLIEQYRDAGGNLAFLSANNFFRRVVEQDGVLTRTQPWRDLGRPEAALLGAQYLANDEGQRQAPFVVRDTTATPWLWNGLGLDTGSLFGRVVGGYGIEIDATTRDSPPGTVVLAEIPDLLGPGKTAQMTYYETAGGAKVFDAGALDFVGSALTYPVNHLLLNLWRHLAVP
jgi:N,N-dimethylformamidase beta subunit-like, C-terminal